jgi:dipeptidyl aminopeptidase/acylaminoacyl peptidase
VRALLLVSLIASTAAAAEPPAVRDLFRPFDTRSYALSPSGRLMVETHNTAHEYWDDPSAAPPLQSQQQVSVIETATGRATSLTAARAGVYSTGSRWIDDSRLVWHSSDLAAKSISAELVKIGAAPDGAPTILDVRLLGRNSLVLSSRDKPAGRVYVQMYDEDGVSVYSIDPDLPFAKQRIEANRVAGPVHRLVDWVIDDQGVVRAYSVNRRRGDLQVFYRGALDQPWRKLQTFPFDRYESSALEGYDAQHDALLMITNRGSDKRVLRELSTKDGALGRTVLGDARNDVSSGSYHPRTGKLIGVGLNDSSVRYEFVEPGIKALQARIMKLASARRISVLAVSDDLSRAVVYAGGPNDPGEYLMFEAAGVGKLRSLAKLAPWLAGATLGASRAIEFKARDGVQLTGIYTPAATPRFKRTPMIVMPHGGPFGVRDYLFYDAEVQFLATRGYSVLQVDFRGSGGYGRDFLKAGYKQWGRAMQDDVTDAVRYAQSQGWAQTDRVCIYGASYGGYAAVMGLIKTPELYRCGATLAGVSDLSLLFKSREVKDDKYLRAWLKDAVGDPEKEKAELRASSPAYLAKGLKLPLFIAHGEKDPRAEVEHAWRLKSAVEAGGGTVEWFLSPEAGHGFSDPKDIETFYNKLDAFFAKHLGDG